jgi:copper transport protein
MAPRLAICRKPWTKVNKRRDVPLLLALLLALLLVGPPDAHANLVRAAPAPGSALAAAPSELVLEFSEELDPGFSKIQLLDSKSQVIDPGPGLVDPAQPTILRLSVAELPKGAYTALWRVRSQVDGHVTEGNLPFGVGVEPASGSLIPAPDAPDPATLPPPPLSSLARWLAFALAAVMLGGLPYGLLVWRPAFRASEREKSDKAATDDLLTRMIRRLVLVSGVLFVLANILFLLTQAATAADVSLGQAFGAPLVQLLAGRSGLLWLARVGLTLAIMALAWRLPPAGRGTPWPWWLALALGGAVLLTFSLNAHGAAEAQGAALATALDWLHLAAMVAWLGGLLPLALTIGAARRTSEGALSLRGLIPRFTRLVAPCLLILTLTGVYAYILHINSLDLVAATTYGRAFAIKIGLFGVLLLLGAVNLFILSPRLRARGNQLAQAFARSVRAELFAGALLLLAVGAMTSVAPSNVAWEEHQKLGLMQEAQVGDVDLVLRVAPAVIGDNEVAVDVTDRRPGAQQAPSKMLLHFGMLGMEMGDLQTEAKRSGTQRYTARGSFMNMGGRWQLEVVLRRAGFDDIRHTFQVDIVRSAAQALP